MFIKVYGESTTTGEIKLIFSCLSCAKSAIRTAKENAARHHYKIHQALLIQDSGHYPKDITQEFINI